MGRLARRGRELGAIVAIAVVAAVLVGCGGAPSATMAPSATPVDPKAELRRTVARLLELQSVSFVLEHTVGATVLTPGIEMNRAYGNVVVPGRFDVTVEARAGNLYVELGAASIDGVTYMTNPITGQWGETLPEAIPINLLDLGRTLAGIVEAVMAPQLRGEAVVEGVDVYHISGSILSEDLRELVPNADGGHNVVLEIWLEQGSGVLRRATITGRVTGDDIAEAQRVLTLDDIDRPITIAPPPGF